MSSFYDYPLIEHRLSAMRKHARNKDIDSMTLALRAGIQIVMKKNNKKKYKRIKRIIKRNRKRK